MIACLKEVAERENNILFKKDTLKKLCYYKSKAWCKLLLNSRQYKFCASLLQKPNILLRSTKISCTQTSVSQYSKKERIESLYFPKEWYITAQKMKFSIKDFFSKCDQIRSFLRILSHLLKKSLMENFIFCVQIAKAYFRYTIWFMFSEKSITRCAFLRIGARVYQKSLQDIQKNWVPKFPILSALKNYLHMGYWFL